MGLFAMLEDILGIQMDYVQLPPRQSDQKVFVADIEKIHSRIGWMPQVSAREGVEAINLGTGNGTSVLQIIKAFSAACGRELPYVIEPRRAGDVTANWADCTKARELMGWEAQFGIAEMCRDSWNWQSHNPNGYEG